MAIEIAGVRVPSLHLSQEDNGKQKVTGNYELISNSGVTLAKQSFNGYSDMEIAFSAETNSLIAKAKKSVAKDINLALGLEEENN